MECGPGLTDNRMKQFLYNYIIISPCDFMGIDLNVKEEVY